MKKNYAKINGAAVIFRAACNYQRKSNNHGTSPSCCPRFIGWRQRGMTYLLRHGKVQTEAAKINCAGAIFRAAEIVEERNMKQE
jgi:hypothetical protein